MLLFYSRECQASRMLIDSIKRYNAESKFKFVDIDVYRSKGIQIPRQIHSIPALFFPDTKATIFQKQVFDFLLLPNKGFLFKQQPTQPLSDPTPFPPASSSDPDSFSFSKTGSSDAYTFIQNDQYVLANDNQRTYNWSDVNTSSSPIPAPEETDTKKKNNLPDLGTLQQEREMALQTYLSH